jgi:CRISPR-associated protein Csx10
MVTCKVAPGFLSQSEPRDPKHGVFDTLLHHLAFNELRRLNAQPHTLPPQRCKHEEENRTCEAALEPFTRRYMRERATRYHPVSSPGTRRMTRVGINRARETAEPGLLYSVQSVTEQTQFVGRITLSDSWDETQVDEFKKALCNINRIGGEQTYGLGRVEVAVREVDDDAEDISTRVSKFNEKLKEVWGVSTAEGAQPAPDAHYLTIDLFTPALLTTPDGTPTVQLTAVMLKQRAEELGFANLPELEVVNGLEASGKERPFMFTGPTIVSGWSEAWGLPKQPTLAAVTGSVYVFRTSNIDAWRDALSKFEERGIGARREEGFGAVRICDPFHLEVKPV